MNNARIWLIGGTTESAELARAIVTQNLPCLVTVTTESARCLYPSAPTLTVWVGRIRESELPAFLKAHSVCAILDASHPFAVEISQLAIAIAGQMSIPYLRFERSKVTGEGEEGGVGLLRASTDGSQKSEVRSQELGVRSQKFEENTLCKSVSRNTSTGLPLPTLPHSSAPRSFLSFESLLSTDLLVGQRVLLTLGYRPLEQFKLWQERAVLFARILPSLTALQAAIAAGFTPERIIALRPPISAELERALWQQWQISMVVTKASGDAGGEDVKRQMAAELGITLVVIERPEIAYPQQTSDLSVALQFCDRVLASRSPD